MSTPLFNILKRNLTMPDEDRGATIEVNMSRRRGLRPETIAAFRAAYRMHNEHGVIRIEACRRAADAAGIGFQSIYCNWYRYKTRLREDGLL